MKVKQLYSCHSSCSKQLRSAAAESMSRDSHAALSSPLVVAPLACIRGTVPVRLRALPLPSVVQPLALVNASMRIFQPPLPFLLVVEKVTGVLVAVEVYEAALSLFFTRKILALVLAAVLVDPKHDRGHARVEIAQDSLATPPDHLLADAMPLVLSEQAQ